MNIGDIVIYRSGKSKSKTVLPIGIANCKVVDFGEGPSGEKCASIKLPAAFEDLMNTRGEPVWVLIDDLEG